MGSVRGNELWSPLRKWSTGRVRCGIFLDEMVLLLLGRTARMSKRCLQRCRLQSSIYVLSILSQLRNKLKLAEFCSIQYDMTCYLRSATEVPAILELRDI